MASINDYDPDLAGDTVTATGKKKQNSFDQTNLPPQYQQPALTPTPAPAASAAPGPVGRAAMQLPATPVTAPAQSLESLRPTGIGDGRSAIYAGVGANGEASFSNTGSSLNSLSSNFTAPNQSPDQRLSALPGLTQMGSAAQQPAQRFPTSLSDLSPGGASMAAAQAPQRSASLAEAMPGYTPSSAAQSPAAQQQANLADAWRGGPSSGSGFAALGSSSNMGDGVGTFSQANQGDAQLAMGRWQKAADLRDGYKAQDRLAQAQGEKWQADHTNVVHDSSRPITRRELKTDAEYDQMRAGAAQNVNLAQAGISAQRQGVAADQQQRQSNRLEDAWTAAMGPNATDVQRQAYRNLTDPDGSKALAQRLTQANINEKDASAAKLRAEANPAGGPKLTEGQSKDYNYYERGNAANGELAGNGTALTNAAVGGRGQARGVIDGLIRSIPGVGNSGAANSLVSNERQKAEQSGREFINALLRKDSGAALTDPEIAEYGRTYLPQPGDSQEVLQQKATARTRALQAIRGGLGNAASITSPVNQGATTGRGGPAVGAVMQGHVFLGGDPANPASWRKQ
jgi:hypothetical protein